MKYKKVSKFFSIIFSVVLLSNFSACNEDLYWSVRSEEEELPAGSYIYNLYLAYNEAKSKLEDTEQSPLDQQIEETNGTEWIKDKALDYTKEAVAWQRKLKELNVELDKEYLDQATQYMDQMGVFNAKFMKEIGVAKDSFLKAYVNKVVAEESAMRALYDEGGSQEVPIADVKKYFLDNYILYQCIQGSYPPNAKDEDKTKLKDTFNSYINEINTGANIQDIAKKYQEENNLQQSPFSEDLCQKSSLNFGDEINKKLENIEQSKAVLLEDSNALYIFVKFPLDDEKEIGPVLAKGSRIRLEILRELKEKDLKDMIKQYKEEIDIELNQGVIDKYTPEFIEKKIKEEKKKQEKQSRKNKTSQAVPQKKEEANSSSVESESQEEEAAAPEE